MTEPVDGRLGCGRLFAEEPGRIPPPMEGLEAGEVIDDLGAIDRAGGDEERLRTTRSGRDAWPAA